jgi:hypothetical protein
MVNATLENSFPRPNRQLESNILENHSESTQRVERQVGLRKRQPFLQVRESRFELILLGSSCGAHEPDFICRYHPTPRPMHLEWSRRVSCRRAHQGVKRRCRIINPEAAEFVLDRA